MIGKQQRLSPFAHWTTDFVKSPQSTQRRSWRLRNCGRVAHHTTNEHDTTRVNDSASLATSTNLHARGSQSANSPSDCRLLVEGWLTMTHPWTKADQTSGVDGWIAVTFDFLFIFFIRIFALHWCMNVIHVSTAVYSVFCTCVYVYCFRFYCRRASNIMRIFIIDCYPW